MPISFVQSNFGNKAI